MAKRGRKSQADLTIAPADNSPYVPPPSELSAPARVLWQSIVRERRQDFFSAGDLPLLREYCHSVAVLIPRVNKLVEKEFDPRTLDARDKLVRQAASLAVRLRICVSARTRGDTAKIRNSMNRGIPPWLDTGERKSG